MNTKDKLIETTQKLLWERGYAAMSPKTIQKESGVGQGSMYHHFSGKKELAIAAISKNSEKMKNDIETIFSEDIPPLNKIIKYLSREREVLKGCPIGRLIYDPDIYSDSDLLEPLEQMFDWIIGKICTTIDQGVDSGDIKGVDPTELSSTITATLQGSYVIARSKRSIEPFKKSINGLITLLKSI